MSNSGLDDLIKDLEKNKALLNEKGRLKKGLGNFILISAVPKIRKIIKYYSDLGSLDKTNISVIFEQIKNENIYVKKYITYPTFRKWYLNYVKKFNEENKV